MAKWGEQLTEIALGLGCTGLLFLEEVREWDGGAGSPPLGSVLAHSRLGSVCPPYLQRVSSPSPAPCKPNSDLVAMGQALPALHR